MFKNSSNCKEIPYGNYCYEPIGIEYDKYNKPIMKVRTCPYYIYLEDGSSKCSLVNITSDDDILFSDQVKVCGFNEENYEFEMD